MSQQHTPEPFSTEWIAEQRQLSSEERQHNAKRFFFAALDLIEQQRAEIEKFISFLRRTYDPVTSGLEFMRLQREGREILAALDHTNT